MLIAAHEIQVQAAGLLASQFLIEFYMWEDYDVFLC